MRLLRKPGSLQTTCKARRGGRCAKSQIRGRTRQCSAPVRRWSPCEPSLLVREVDSRTVAHRRKPARFRRAAGEENFFVRPFRRDVVSPPLYMQSSVCTVPQLHSLSTCFFDDEKPEFSCDLDDDVGINKHSPLSRRSSSSKMLVEVKLNNSLLRSSSIYIFEDLVVTAPSKIRVGNIRHSRRTHAHRIAATVVRSYGILRANREFCSSV